MRIVVEVDDEFHRQVKILAAKEGRPIADIVRDLLSVWLQVGNKSMRGHIVVHGKQLDAVGPVMEQGRQTRGKA